MATAVTSSTSGFLGGFTQAVIANVNKCSRCAYDVEAWCYDAVVDNELPLKTCKSCEQPHGFDDTSAIDELERLVRDGLTAQGVGQCPCGNTDIDAFDVDGNDLLCLRCNKKVYAHDESEAGLQCQNCGNADAELINIHEEEEGGGVTGVECLVCERGKYSVPDGGESPQRRYNMELIKDYSTLSPGDHVAWCRPWLGYYHHALVCESNYDGYPERVLVFEYGKDKINEKARVRMRVVDLNKEMGNLYRYNYSSLYDASMAVIRAVNALGEEAYDAFTNNCEHFVRWCKTGMKSCTQVCTLKRKMLEMGKSFWAYFSLSKIGTGTARVAATAVAANVGAEAAAEAFEFLLVGRICPIFEVLGAVAIVAIESWNFYKDYKQHKADLLEQKIDKHEFTNRNIRSGVLCTTRGTCSVVGGIVGELLCPIPIVGGVLGAAIGALIGQLCGHYLGHAITYLRDKFKK